MAKDIKAWLAAAVSEKVQELSRFTEFEGHGLEINEIAPTELMIRAKPIDSDGAPRYFRVKISEVM